MNRTIQRRREGMALLGAVVMLIAIFAVSGSVLFVSLAQSKAIHASTQEKMSFFLAEAGLEAGKCEINESRDTGGDGIGNATRTATLGGFATTYIVSCEDLGSDLFRLRSTGTAGQARTTLEAIVERSRSTAFPLAALSVVGSVNKAKLKFKDDPTLTIDGGYSPAISVTDKALYDELGEQLGKAIIKRKVQANLSGSSTNPFLVPQGKKKDSGSTEVQLPIELQTEFPDRLKDLGGLYLELVDRVTNTIIPAAQVVKSVSGGKTTLGSADKPGVYYLPETMVLKTGQTLDGFGTLVVSDLMVEKSAALSWEGNLIVIGDSKKSAKLSVKDGKLEVKGNLVILGEGKEESRLSIKDGEALVEGSFLLATDYDEKKAKKAALDLDYGDLEVEGLVTMLGSKIDVKVDKWSDLDVTGMFQIGQPDGPSKEDLKLTFEGDTEIIKDDGAIQKGIDALRMLGTLWDLGRTETILSQEIETHAWYPVH